MWVCTSWEQFLYQIRPPYERLAWNYLTVVDPKLLERSFLVACVTDKRCITFVFGGILETASINGHLYIWFFQWTGIRDIVKPSIRSDCWLRFSD